jgi:hypothetical protein
VIHLLFTESTYAWTNEYRLSIKIGDSSYESAQSGGLTGNYTQATAGILTGTIDSDSRSATFTREGQAVVDDVGDLFVGINPARPFELLPFACDGPTIMVGAGSLASDSFPITLTPASAS